MQFTNNEISTYLFCAQLPHTKTTPLTILEWNAIVKSLSEHKMQPEALITMTPSGLLKVLTKATEAQKPKILKKIEARQQLGISMLELEDIANQGYGVMFRSHMPPRLKKLTQKFIPPFFYYAGDPSILTNQTLGVVGARDANSDELLQTAKISKKAVMHGVVIISGGARGVDTTAVEAALENGGRAVVFPADGISKWIKKSTNRQYIMNGQLLLMSSQNLDASFSGSYAMQRNKYIHAPSDAVLVASSKISGKKASGTWEGVLENLKYCWSPLYVIGESDGIVKLLSDGNAKLFSSIEEIFKSRKHSKTSDKNNFEQKISEVIKFAIEEGMDKQTIGKSFTAQLEKFFTKDEMAEKENSQKQEELEQLSIDDLLKREVN